MDQREVGIPVVWWAALHRSNVSDKNQRHAPIMIAAIAV